MVISLDDISILKHFFIKTEDDRALQSIPFVAKLSKLLLVQKESYSPEMGVEACNFEVHVFPPLSVVASSSQTIFKCHSKATFPVRYSNL